MGCFSFSFFFFICCVFLPSLTFSASISTHSISPDFTASYFQFKDTRGAFLRSQDGTFKATIDAARPPSTKYYFSVVHSATNIIIWSANRNTPMSSSDKLSLTVNGLMVTNQTGQPLWSTPQFNSDISAMQLSETGNLVLVDAGNNTLWESFAHPTDTIVMGQRIPIGKSLQSAVTADEDMSVGDYRLEVTDSDVVLQWNKMNYWSLSMDQKAVRNSKKAVSLMVMNGTGLYLLASDNSTVVQVALSGSSRFKSGKLGPDGRFSIVRPPQTQSDKWEVEFAGPFEDCDLPLNCKEFGLCRRKPLGGICSCLPEFSHQNNGDNCMPVNRSLSLPSACTAARNGSQLNSSISYLKFGPGMDYFANNFKEPVKNNVTLSVCQNLCSENCSCLGFFHEISSGSCYLLANHLGSFILADHNKDRLGYIKVLVGSSNGNSIGSNINQKQNLPVAALVLLPLTGFLMLVVFVIIAILWLRKKRLSKTTTVKLDRSNSSSSAELEMVSIPGLPRRFAYEELAAATENFKTQIGSGGFGTVYRGTLSDKTVVAVKKITSLGIQGKKEFCTEVSIIGNIHHVNLVRLKGFCAQGRQRFLVLEYMNRGSLGSTLFGNGPVLEWQERLEIAIGTARGLAYLHSGCEHRIIHCDVKPENILLNDNLQVKISDFGLSKLLNPEQSFLFTTMRGTRGYLAPEWIMSSTISDKADVYSYGLVLLEIVRGRKNCSIQTWNHSTKTSSSEGNASSSSPPVSEHRLIYFPLFALEMHQQRRYLELADPRLEGRVTSEEVEKLVRIALCCMHEDPALRPSMAHVVGMLEGGLPLGEPRSESLNFLRFYGQRFVEMSRMEGSNELMDLGLYPHINATSNSAAGVSYNPMSYISSQQLSGPR
ncbi:G-type lectin S-receptor-like serine/threonine-protein kinase At5g35370 isoform X2 [Quercus robur]|uniref:G-type lectin S-receptor-like serine/threonine-protein kinase At5g35370 isoform X2 n=1 Tax=Quercus robur TaxID=38942 RepID=UPI002161BBF4|nr:G-type lectin S-receptor-like serine/threonine-protein kinase At5g35370 isoform X2 [Quercus robur]